MASDTQKPKDTPAKQTSETNEGLVKMGKNGEVLFVDPGVVMAHEAEGWARL